MIQNTSTIQVKKSNKRLILFVLLAALFICAFKDLKKGLEAGYSQTITSKVSKTHSNFRTEEVAIIFPLIKFN